MYKIIPNRQLIKLLLFSVFFYAQSGLALETSGDFQIKRLIFYNTFGNGDVYLSLETSSPTCSSGYYINKDSASYDSIVQTLRDARNLQRRVRIVGDETSQWSGSSLPVCLIYSVETYTSR